MSPSQFLSAETSCYRFSHNRLSMPTEFAAFATAFARLKELQISTTLTTWPQVCQLVSLMPSLRLLEVGYNRLHRLVPFESHATFREHSTLQVINFDGNALYQWSEVCDSLRQFTW